MPSFLVGTTSGIPQHDYFIQVEDLFPVVITMIVLIKFIVTVVELLINYHHNIYQLQIGYNDWNISLSASHYHV